MKILVQAVKGNHLHGFKSLFEAKKHQWIWWEESHTPAFDVFDELQPDLFIGYGEVSRAVIKCLKMYSYKTKVMCQIGPYTYVVKGETLSFPFLVNTEVHHAGADDNKLACDIGCCEPPHPYLLSLCHPVGKFKIKILGDTPWPVPQYIGLANWSDLVKLYQSASLVFANDIEEIGRAMACGALCLTANEEASKLLQEHIVFVDCKEALYDECHQLLTSRTGERVSIVQNALRYIYDNNLTYEHAFKQICSKLKI